MSRSHSGGERWPWIVLALVLTGPSACLSCSPGDVPQACRGAERRCASDRLEECNATETGFELVELCDDGCNSTLLECNICNAGTTQCEDETTMRICSADGLRVTPTRCEDATPFCLGDTGRCVACVPLSAQCEDVNLQRTCGPDGRWHDAKPCAADETCFLGVCGGECRKDDQRCVPGVDHYEVCGAQGEWGPPVDCGTGTSSDWDVCREGVCVDSPMYAVGYDDVSGWDTTNWFRSSLIVIPVEVESDVRVFELQLITATGGGFAKMAVWDDSNGYPDKLVIASDNKVAVRTGAERVSRFLISKHPELDARRTYWVGAVFSDDVTLYWRYNESTKYLRYNYDIEGDFTDLDPFPSPAWPGNPNEIGLSIVVKDLL